MPHLILQPQDTSHPPPLPPRTAVSTAGGRFQKRQRKANNEAVKLNGALSFYFGHVQNNLLSAKYYEILEPIFFFLHFREQ